MSNIKNLEVIKNFIEISSTILTLWISILVYRLQKKENNPRLVIEHKLVDENIIRIEDEFFFKNRFRFEHDKRGDGFPYRRYNDDIYMEDENMKDKYSCIEIENKGNFPATNVNLILYIDLKRTFWKFGDDEADVKSKKVRKYKSEKIKYKINYIPPGKKIRRYIFRYEGQFIEFDVKVRKLKSKELKFIKKYTLIDTVRHEGLKYLSDSKDEREVYGCIRIKED